MHSDITNSGIARNGYIRREVEEQQRRASIESPLRCALQEERLVLRHFINTNVIIDRELIPGGHSDPNLLRVEMFEFYLATSISNKGLFDGVRYISGTIFHEKSPDDGTEFYKVRRSRDIEDYVCTSFREAVAFLVSEDTLLSASLPSAS